VDEALVRVHASSLNASDLETLRGEFVVRMTAPRKPKYEILGSDFAGRIEAVGRTVKQFQPGDEIWGDLSFPLSYGAFAEYVCVPESALRLKPASMTFEQAAAVPTAGVVALQKLRCKGPIRPGQKILINGAGGGVGTFAVQLAKLNGAEVTAVDSAIKLDMLRTLGADHVVDYAQEDFTRNGQCYDLILDIVAHRSIFDTRRALSPEGTYVPVGGSTGVIFQALLLGPLISKIGSRKVAIGEWKPNDKDDLALLTGLFEAGKVTIVVDKSYPLSEVPEAMHYLGEGHAQGKVVINHGA
jgi:NADPH:quinone reductase-like Zn-dependent oxidoreductase